MRVFAGMMSFLITAVKVTFGGFPFVMRSFYLVFMSVNQSSLTLILLPLK
jgi:hypothetical protein